MKIFFLIFLLFILGCSSANEIVKYDDIEDMLDTCVQKRTIIYFMNSSCTTCDSIELVFKHHKIRNYIKKNNMLLIKVNLDKNEFYTVNGIVFSTYFIAMGLHVSHIPTVVFLSKKRIPIAYYDSVVYEDELYNFLQKLIKFGN